MSHPDATSVTVTEIADLLARLRILSPPQPGAATARAEFLAAKADLLARIADQHARDWPCDHAAQVRQVAADAHAMAEHARAATEPTSIDSEDHTS
jgi:Lon protease-like protein